MRVENNKVFFWGSVFSNWYPCKFVYKNIEFNCSEQALMYEKAMLFNDKDIAEQILNAETPKEQKSLGRKVSNYNDNIWNENRMQIMIDILTAKFSQSDKLKNKMLKYKGYTFVEASPVDTIWGIGLHEDNDLVLDENNWKGQNLLGKCLTYVCNHLND